jgi:hypothetical protein
MFTFVLSLRLRSKRMLMEVEETVDSFVCSTEAAGNQRFDNW